MKPNRMVRCERCGNEWAAVREAEAVPDGDAAPRADEQPEPHDHLVLTVSDTDRLAAPAHAEPRSAALLAAWIASCAVLAVALAATVTWRADLVRAWPPSARLLGSAPLAARAAPSAVAKPPGEKPEKAGAPRG